MEIAGMDSAFMEIQKDSTGKTQALLQQVIQNTASLPLEPEGKTTLSWNVGAPCQDGMS